MGVTYSATMYVCKITAAILCKQPFSDVSCRSMCSSELSDLEKLGLFQKKLLSPPIEYLERKGKLELGKFNNCKINYLKYSPNSVREIFCRIG